MAQKSFTSLARKTLLRRGRAILRLRQDYGDSKATGDGPDYLVGLSDAERHELEEVHAALERIERGIFGRCQVCLVDMDRDRLAPRPYLRTCTECDSKAAIEATAAAAAAAQI